ncbi:Amino-acid acetyltransferase [subsurface metagenome]
MNAGDEQKSGLEVLALSIKACREGVNRAHIVDGRIEGVILEEIFSNLGSGAMVYSNQYENIRTMEPGDTPHVLRLMQPFVEKGLLLSRGEQDMLAHCGDYVLYEVDGTIHGCGALHIYPQGQGEVAGIAVDKKYAHLGIGNKIVAFLLEKARRLNLTRIFVLTTQASDWFLELGFEQGEVKELPEKKRELYDSSRNSRILIYNNL